MLAYFGIHLNNLDAGAGIGVLQGSMVDVDFIHGFGNIHLEVSHNNTPIISLQRASQGADPRRDDVHGWEIFSVCLR